MGVCGAGGAGCTYVTVGCTGVGAGRGAGCAFGVLEKVVAPQRGQNEAPDFNSLLQFEQYIFAAVNGRPQPVQKVSPGSYGVLQFGQCDCDETAYGADDELTTCADGGGRYLGSDGVV